MSPTDSAPEPVPAVQEINHLVRHLVATLAYRTAKVVREPPDDFATLAVGGATRSPVHVLAHMGDLIDWSISLIGGDYVWTPASGSAWDTEVARFFSALEAFDRQLLRPLPAGTAELLLQGPLADALTHVGQLAMQRRLAGAPLGPESYVKAAIVVGRVGLDQVPGVVITPRRVARPAPPDR